MLEVFDMIPVPDTDTKEDVRTRSDGKVIRSLQLAATGKFTVNARVTAEFSPTTFYASALVNAAAVIAVVE
jgi:hypothetical protein